MSCHWHLNQIRAVDHTYYRLQMFRPDLDYPTVKKLVDKLCVHLSFQNRRLKIGKITAHVHLSFQIGKIRIGKIKGTPLYQSAWKKIFKNNHTTFLSLYRNLSLILKRF